MIKERKEREARGESVMDLDEQGSAPAVTKEMIREANQRWEDNQITSEMFQLIQMNDVDALGMVLENMPMYAHMRSKDGRGPMWWAHEHGRKKIIKLLKRYGVSDKLRDKDGMTPLDLMDDEF